MVVTVPVESMRTMRLSLSAAHTSLPTTATPLSGTAKVASVVTLPSLARSARTLSLRLSTMSRRPPAASQASCLGLLKRGGGADAVGVADDAGLAGHRRDHAAGEVDLADGVVVDVADVEAAGAVGDDAFGLAEARVGGGRRRWCRACRRRRRTEVTVALAGSTARTTWFSVSHR